MQATLTYTSAAGGRRVRVISLSAPLARTAAEAVSSIRIAPTTLLCAQRLVLQRPLPTDCGMLAGAIDRMATAIIRSCGVAREEVVRGWIRDSRVVVGYTLPGSTLPALARALYALRRSVLASTSRGGGRGVASDEDAMHASRFAVLMWPRAEAARLLAPRLWRVVSTERRTTLETGTLETGTLETGTLETGTLETGTLETGTLETGTLETGTLETATLETATLETATLETEASLALDLNLQPDLNHHLDLRTDLDEELGRLALASAATAPRQASTRAKLSLRQVVAADVQLLPEALLLLDTGVELVLWQGPLPPHPLPSPPT